MRPALVTREDDMARTPAHHLDLASMRPALVTREDSYGINYISLLDYASMRPALVTREDLTPTCHTAGTEHSFNEARVGHAGRPARRPRCRSGRSGFNEARVGHAGRRD